MTQLLDRIRAAIPAEGLFAEKEWLVAAEPFRISAQLHDQLEKLGYRLSLFNRACNELYYRSISGKQPRWIADYLDRGKPAELVELSREKKLRSEVPMVIRPDLVLTDAGFAIAEIDSVPGGIGLTGWLNETYAALGFDVIGGPSGMRDGFRSILGERTDILISQEAITYKPEMEWLARGTGGALQVHAAEAYSRGEAPNIYRFFELFDLPNVPGASELLAAGARGELRITPPPKPFLEEKMWFALFWLRPLRDFWRRELSERHFSELQKHIPYTWLLDPQPLPQHAVIPGLDINGWTELAEFSQSQRDLIIKVSGFHETAWGSRSVVLGSDMAQGDWQAAIDHALHEFASNPHILQRFHKGALFDQRYFAGDGGLQTMRGRVRLCPYYFLENGKAELRGALATVCPADKKLLHGMKDAVLAPTGAVIA